MQRRIFLASALALVSAPGAQAETWCGQRVNATIQCGYSSRAECEKANVGKGAMCFINKADEPPNSAPTLPPTLAPPRGTDAPTFTLGR
jgi:hypothetical protein